MKNLGKKIVSVLIVVTISASFVGSAFAQNSLSWNQDGKKFTINLHTGALSITCFDNDGNAFTIQEPEYDIDFSSNANVTYYHSGYGAYAGKVENIGSTHITYYHSGYGAYAGKVENAGSAHITYYHDGYGAYAGKVQNISGKVR